ncbi:MAG: EamA family transporter [Hyphomicrobiales bacterium]
MTERQQAPSWIGAAPLLFVFMWATGFIVARLAAPHADPMWFLALRFGISCLILTAIALITGSRWPRPVQTRDAMVAGALIHGGYLGPVYWAVAHGMPAGVSALIVGLQPLLTSFFAALLIGEAIGRRQWQGLIVGLAGIALVVSPKLTLAALGGITPLTILVTILGAVSISFGTVYQKRHGAALDLAAGGAWQYAGGTIVTFLGTLLFGRFRFDATLEAWTALVWSVLVLSLGAITLLMLLIRHGSVSRVSGLIFLVPAVAAAMAYLLFDETLSAVQIAGMALCGAAVFLVTRPSE